MTQSARWWFWCLVCLGVFAVKVSAYGDAFDVNPDNIRGNPNNMIFMDFEPLREFLEALPRPQAPVAIPIEERPIADEQRVEEPRAMPVYILGNLGRDRLDDNVADFGLARRED